MNQDTKLFDYSSLATAINVLIEALQYYHSDLAQQDPHLALHLMAATIKAFEFTYDLSVKYLRRYLETTEPSAEIISEMSSPSLIRTANQRDLLKNDVSIWKKYRDMRNITSHTYQQEKAQEVMSIIPDFLVEAQYFLNQLQKRSKML